MKSKVFFLTGMSICLFVFLVFAHEKASDTSFSPALDPEKGDCTSILVTKGASEDGSLFTTHSCDGGWEFRLKVVPGQTHKTGAKRPVFKGGGRGAERNPAVQVAEIPQVERTFSRFDIAYPFMNEKQLASGETTFGGRRELYNPQGKWDIMALLRIIMERCTTAREAIRLMGELTARDGYGDSGECLTLIDKNEAWVFEIMGSTPLETGSVWAARRVPDGEVFVSANRSRIGELDLNDKDNFLASANVYSLAEKRGWYDPKKDKVFLFNKVYAPDDDLRCSRREWRVLSTLSPASKLDPWAKHYPFSVKPGKKVRLEDLKTLHRDYYQGTEFDMSVGLAAGPYANPNRFSTRTPVREGYMGWERSISIFRCAYCVISQTRDWLPDMIGGLAWFAEDDPKTSCFIPLYGSIAGVPESFQTGRRDVFDRRSAWWAFDFVGNWANLRFDLMIEDIRTAYGEFEDTFAAEQKSLEQAALDLYKKDPEQCRGFLTRLSSYRAQKAVDDWWDLADFLIVKYNDGYINKGAERESPGYPEDWLDAVGYGKQKIKKAKKLP
jgi:dipeptidase